MFKLEKLDISYKEFSAWGSLAISFALLVYYINKISQLSSLNQLNNESHFTVLFTIVIATVAMHIIFHIVLAISRRVEAEQNDDERDKMYALKATNYAYHVTLAWITILLVEMVLGSNGLFNPVWPWPQFETTDKVIFLVFVGLTLSEWVNHISTIVLYRKG